MDEMPKRLQIVYQDALTNLLFIKRQQWAVARYGLLAYAALFAVSTTLKERVALAILAIALAIYIHFVLRSFIKGMARFRDRVRWIYENDFMEQEQNGLRLLEEKDPFDKEGFTTFLQYASGVCCVITVLAILFREP
jgi:hypothetical protein